MALTTKSVSPLTHFNQDYYNNLKRNVSFAEAEKYRLKVTQARPKAINLGEKGAFSKLTEGQIRGYDEQNKIAQEQKEQREADIASGKITDLGKLPQEEEENQPPQDPPVDETGDQQEGENQQQSDPPSETQDQELNDNQEQQEIKAPTSEEQTEVKEITREEVIQLLKDNNVHVEDNIGYKKAIIRAKKNGLL